MIECYVMKLNAYFKHKRNYVCELKTKPLENVKNNCHCIKVEIIMNHHASKPESELMSKQVSTKYTIKLAASCLQCKPDCGP